MISIVIVVMVVSIGRMGFSWMGYFVVFVVNWFIVDSNMVRRSMVYFVGILLNVVVIGVVISSVVFVKGVNCVKIGKILSVS